jgi:hypothetical protein
MALYWPVDTMIVTGNFGESRVDHFHAGIDIGGGEQDVHPVLDGELVFRYDEDADYSSLPRGVGSFVVLDHSVERLLSIYCHLKKESIPTDKTLFTRQDGLGVIGDTGYSEGKHLHLEIYDIEGSFFDNPLSTLFPPVPDRQQPVIKQIVLRSGNRLIRLESGVVVPPGKAEVLAEVYDPRADVRYLWPMAPYSVRLALNGKEISRLEFKLLRVKDGKTVVNDTALGVSEIYGEERFMRVGGVELSGGESHFLLDVRDIAGNEVVKEFFFTVSE